MLVLIDADAGGKKELLAIDDGFRASEQSWHELLVRLRDEKGVVIDPELATGDGALGFWKAAKKVWPTTGQQRCWVHKTANLPAEVGAEESQGRPSRPLRGRAPGGRRGSSSSTARAWLDVWTWTQRFDVVRDRQGAGRSPSPLEQSSDIERGAFAGKLFPVEVYL